MRDYNKSKLWPIFKLLQLLQMQLFQMPLYQMPLLMQAQIKASMFQLQLMFHNNSKIQRKLFKAFLLIYHMARLSMKFRQI